MSKVTIYATETRTHAIELDVELFEEGELKEFIKQLENGEEDQLFAYISDNTVEDADIDFEYITYRE